MDVVTGVSGWWMIPVLAAGFFYASILYFRNTSLPFSNALTAILFVLRFATVSLIAFLLLTPYFKQNQKIVEQPLILLAQDNSASVWMNKDSVLYQTGIKSVFEKLKQSLAKELAVQGLTFDSKVNYDGAIDFSGQRTDFSKLLQTTANDYFNRNVGALVILTDGIGNSGIPAELLMDDYPFPVYVLALGDTMKYPDLAIADIRYNKVVYQQSDFPVEVSVKCQDAMGKTITLELLINDKVIATSGELATSYRYHASQSFMVSAPADGQLRMTAHVVSLQGEKLTRNNSRTFFLDVVNQKRKVLLLAHAPHPDLGAIQTVLSPHFDVKTAFPSTLDDFDESYQLIVLHGLPSQNTDQEKVRKLLAQQTATPVLFILGPQTDFPLFNSLQSGVRMQSVAKSPWVPATAISNSSFTLFHMDDFLLERLTRFPALNVPLAEYELSPNFHPFLDQQIKGIKTTYPLIGFAQSPFRLQGYILGSGIWQWRLADFQMNGNHQTFNDLISKTTQYMLVIKDDKRLKIFHEPVFMLSDELSFRAEFYNQSMQKINTGPLEIEFKHEETGNTYKYAFSTSEDGYVLNAGRLPAGRYYYQAEIAEGETKQIAKGEFLVEAFSLEGLTLTADHSMLKKLSNKSGGLLFYPGQEEALANAIINNPTITSVSYHSSVFEKWENLPFVLMMILLMASLEWFLRKYNGQY